MPFGQPRFNNTPVTDFAYTGQRDLDMQGNSFSLGLMDYNARFYDESLGRFISPDSIVPDGNPQSLNRYSYVQNDPIGLNDPTGHNQCDAIPVGPARDFCNNSGYGVQQQQEDVQNSNDLCAGMDGINSGICQLDKNAPKSKLGEASNEIASDFISAVQAGGPFILLLPAVVFEPDDFFENPEVDTTLSDLNTAGQGVEDVLGIEAASNNLQELVDDANQQYPNLAEKADQLHHIFPQYLGGDPNGTMVSLPAAYHQVITNAFRAAWAYEQGAPPLDVALQIMQDVYNKFPLP